MFSRIFLDINCKKAVEMIPIDFSINYRHKINYKSEFEPLFYLVFSWRLIFLSQIFYKPHVGVHDDLMH